jgi:hypothetical protein
MDVQLSPEFAPIDFFWGQTLPPDPDDEPMWDVYLNDKEN